MVEEQQTDDDGDRGASEGDSSPTDESSALPVSARGSAPSPVQPELGIDGAAYWQTPDALRLQPLSLELIAVQLDRLDITYERTPQALLAGYQTFTLSARALGDDASILFLRAQLRNFFPAASIPALSARCNWWNRERLMLSASVATGIASSTAADEADITRNPVALINLDFVCPLVTGVAPIQLSTLVRQFVSRASSFEQETAIDTISSLSW